MEASCLATWSLPAALLLFLLLLYLYGTWTFSTFVRFDIPGPKPAPFLGNMLEVRKKGFFGCVLEWRRQYGRNFGIYIMREPMLLTTDLNIVKEVFVKDFANFTSRSNLPRRTPTFNMSDSLVFSEGETWRRLRHTLAPTFSTAKLKLMGSFVNWCCNNLCHTLQRQTEKGELVDVKRTFGAYTIDVIAGTAFGIETDFLANEGDAFLQAAITVTRKSNTFGWRSALITLFPCLTGIVKLMGDSSSAETLYLMRLIDQLIEDRKKDGHTGRVDLLQLMLDAEATQASIAARPQDRQMTREEIIAQCITFLLAGYETMATTLQYMVYLLALNPDKDDKLYKEIIASIGDTSPSYDSVMGIKYLDNTIFETLRRFPPLPIVSRRAAEARTYHGVTIKHGTCVGIPVYAIMHDEELFHEPHEFVPERFDDEAIPAILRELAFGAGPRQCISMRLALYEAKMAAVTVLRRFKFLKVPETPDFVTFNTSAGFSTTVKPILVGTELRK